MTILARVMGRKVTTIINLSAIVEIHEASNGWSVLYFSNNCMAHGASFNVTAAEIGEMVISPVHGDDGIVDMVPVPEIEVLTLVKEEEEVSKEVE